MVMKVDSVKNLNNKVEFCHLVSPQDGSNSQHTNVKKYEPHETINQVSFKGSGGNFQKYCKLLFRQLSNYMKSPIEMTNAEIAFIGTGAIAPFAIMCSPGKKTACQEDKEADRERKIFQALRQPVSAALAFGFQVPTTMGIEKGFNYLAYKKHIKMFDDEVLGHLIPDNKYLQKQAKKVLKGTANQDVMKDWEKEYKMVQDFGKYKPEFLLPLLPPCAWPATFSPWTPRAQL